MSRSVVVGAGYVGRAAARALSGLGHAVDTLSARALLRGDVAPGPADFCVFAHGKPVTVRRFDRHFDDLFASRAEPLRAARSQMAPDTRAVLISSTVACLLDTSPPARDLPALQRAFETAFLELFPHGSILRLGAMRGPGWQIDQGLPGLARTRLLKRVRMTGKTDIPWADDALLAEALRRAVGRSASLRQVVAYPRGFDINRFLDDGVGPLAFRMVLPDAWFRGLYAGMGAPPAFMTITMAAVLSSGWDLIASSAPEQGRQVGAPEAHLAAKRDRIAIPV